MERLDAPEEQCAGSSSNPVQTTVEAVQEGKCVIDFGATKSLRSIYALEKLMARNIKETGDAAVQHVDHKFGNSSSDRCQDSQDG